MQVLAIYQVNEHIAELMAEAEAGRMARGGTPKRSLWSIVTSLFTFRAPAASPAAS